MCPTRRTDLATREDILSEIKRQAEENNGQPPGAGKFARESGTSPHQWEKHWSTWSQALQEAGFAPNKFVTGYSEDDLLDQFIYMAKTLNRLPTGRDLKVGRTQDPKVPSQSAFARLGLREDLVGRVLHRCRTVGGSNDVVRMCEEFLS